MADTKYPEVEVQLSDQNGNAMLIIGRTSAALRRAGVSRDEITKYQEEAMSGDYNNVLSTTMQWVDVS